MARFEATVVKGKRRQLWYYNSRLFKLIRKTTSRLRKKYKNRSPRPDWYIQFGFYRVFGFKHVPKEEIPNLKKTFEKYVDHVLETKRHRHLFVFVRKDDRSWIWLKCMSCDAIDQVIYNNYEGVARKVILPYWLSLKQDRPLYRSGWERRKIQQFLAEYKERAIQSVAAEIDQQILKRRKKLEKARAEKKKRTLQEQIQKLQEERKTYEMINLIL